MTRRDDLNNERARLVRQASEAETQLQEIDQHCLDGQGHDWGDVRFNPIHRAGYYIPGDRERGIELGVDSRPGYQVPSETKKQWTRTCKKCDYEQHTDKTKTVQRGGSVPGTVGTEEVPVFPNT